MDESIIILQYPDVQPKQLNAMEMILLNQLSQATHRALIVYGRRHYENHVAFKFNFNLKKNLLNNLRVSI